jgi:hypothetical protein
MLAGRMRALMATSFGPVKMSEGPLPDPSGAGGHRIEP